MKDSKIGIEARTFVAQRMGERGTAMMRLKFDLSEGRRPSILCLGAHCDDIEIGCGGTVLQLLRNRKEVNLSWVVLSSEKGRAEEARNSASHFLRGANNTTIEVKDFPNSFFPYSGERIKVYFESMKAKFQPDLIFTHYRHDLHQDHRVVSELTWNTFRDHMILEYEIPKYDGDLGSPNTFVPLNRDVCAEKIEMILRSFKSQSGKQWFTEDLFLSVMRIRGMECNAQHGLAEGFYCRKAPLQLV
jgi:LmbE family N-acetylglucosaminyl deacetylase